MALRGGACEPCISQQGRDPASQPQVPTNSLVSYQFTLQVTSMPCDMASLPLSRSAGFTFIESSRSICSIGAPSR